MSRTLARRALRLLAIGPPHELAAKHLATKLNIDIARRIVDESIVYNFFGNFVSSTHTGFRSAIVVYASEKLTYWRIEVYVHVHDEQNKNILLGVGEKQLWVELTTLIETHKPGFLEVMTGVEQMESNASNIKVSYIDGNGLYTFREALRPYITTNMETDDEDKHFHERWIINEYDS